MVPSFCTGLSDLNVLRAFEGRFVAMENGSTAVHQVPLNKCRIFERVVVFLELLIGNGRPDTAQQRGIPGLKTGLIVSLQLRDFVQVGAQQRVGNLLQIQIDSRDVCRRVLSVSTGMTGDRGEEFPSRPERRLVFRRFRPFQFHAPGREGTVFLAALENGSLQTRVITDRWGLVPTWRQRHRTALSLRLHRSP
jgi:hypothetical protein